jgi:hypothetical protein
MDKFNKYKCWENKEAQSLLTERELYRPTERPPLVGENIATF